MTNVQFFPVWMFWAMLEVYLAFGLYPDPVHQRLIHALEMRRN